MKRIREGEITTMANYLNLILLSAATTATAGEDEEFTRVFTCKTCDRQFSSFQALGGHRASHKKPRVTMPEAGDHRQPPPMSPPKPKTHECPVCGLEFPIGQALGGHMRRHRVTAGGGGTGHDDRRMEVNNKNNNRRRILCVDLNLTPMENKFAAVDCFF